MKTNRSYILKLALYCSSIIIGSGLLTLPLVAARLGYVPLLVIIILAGLWMAYVSRRTAESLFYYINQKSQEKAEIVSAGLRIASGGIEPDGKLVNHETIMTDEVRKHGSRILSELVHDAGFGMAGRVTILLGTFLYVFLADISYVLIGSGSLIYIGQFIANNFPTTFPVILVVGILLVVASWKFDLLFTKPFLMHGTLKKVSIMAGAWLIGISILGFYYARLLAQFGTVLMDMLGLGLFTCAVLAGMFTNSDESNMLSSGDLSDQHTVNVLVMLAEIVLLIITVLITLVVVYHNQVSVPFFGIAEDSFSYSSIPAWSRMIGVVIFAFVGTGLFNLLSYPRLFEKPKSGNTSRLAAVVILGTLIPMVVYLVWTITSSTILTPNELTMLDKAKDFTTTGIARRFESINITAALLITIFGYSLALLAVTSACNGFTESLADQINAGFQRISHLKWLSGDQKNLKMRLVILVAAIVSAFAVNHLSVEMDISSIISVAGNAGGGLLVLILPFFLPERGNKKTRWSSVMVGLMSAIFLTLLSLNIIDIATVQDSASAVVAVIYIAIAISIIIMTIWLIRSEPSFKAE